MAGMRDILDAILASGKNQYSFQRSKAQTEQALSGAKSGYRHLWGTDDFDRPVQQNSPMYRWTEAYRKGSADVGDDFLVFEPRYNCTVKTNTNKSSPGKMQEIDFSHTDLSNIFVVHKNILQEKATLFYDDKYCTKEQAAEFWNAKRNGLKISDKLAAVAPHICVHAPLPSSIYDPDGNLRCPRDIVSGGQDAAFSSVLNYSVDISNSETQAIKRYFKGSSGQVIFKDANAESDFRRLIEGNLRMQAVAAKNSCTRGEQPCISLALPDLFLQDLSQETKKKVWIMYADALQHIGDDNVACFASINGRAFDYLQRAAHLGANALGNGENKAFSLGDNVFFVQDMDVGAPYSAIANSGKLNDYMVTSCTLGNAHAEYGNYPLDNSRGMEQNAFRANLGLSAIAFGRRDKTDIDMQVEYVPLSRKRGLSGPDFDVNVFKEGFMRERRKIERDLAKVVRDGANVNDETRERRASNINTRDLSSVLSKHDVFFPVALNGGLFDDMPVVPQELRAFTEHLSLQGKSLGQGDDALKRFAQWVCDNLGINCAFTSERKLVRSALTEACEIAGFTFFIEETPGGTRKIPHGHTIGSPGYKLRDSTRSQEGPERGAESKYRE